MHHSTKTIGDSDLGPARRSTSPCAKCKAMAVDVHEITSSDHEDYCIICTNCGHRYCVDGDDG